MALLAGPTLDRHYLAVDLCEAASTEAFDMYENWQKLAVHLRGLSRASSYVRGSKPMHAVGICLATGPTVPLGNCSESDLPRVESVKGDAFNVKEC